MQKTLFLIGCLLCLLIPAHGQESPEKTAQPLAEQWLVLMDDEKYGNTWTEAASSFKQAVQQPQWENMARSVRKPLGKPAGRTLKSAKYTQSLPNAPAGEYVVLQYQTAFATVSATETVTMVLDTDKQWRTAGYFVK